MDTGKGKRMKEIFFTKPIFKEVLWGGEKLRDLFGYEIPSNHTGECWAISGHEHGDCEIAEGKYKGKTLGWLWKEKRELFGNLEGDQFPLLVKIIDAKEDLSIQVHPDDAYAKIHEHGSLGKTECWYVLDAQTDTEIMIGHTAKTKEELYRMIDEERWENLVRKRSLKKGDFYQINPGTIHAIMKGSFILEIQQSSDVTYRLYDYNRCKNGKKRQLHTDKGKDVIVCPYQDISPDRVREENEDYITERMITCPKYTVEKIEVRGRAEFEQNHPFILCSVLEGQGFIDHYKIKKGSHFIIPSDYKKYSLEGNLILMETWL